ncbi:hypothetical protein chiPu_0023062, partial [Chiloscyllium punctatum]|nr:hypothetical protein [Chiloscyllium punctatum]
GEFSHLVLMAAFDCIDDTKLMKQIILTEIIEALPNLIENKYGKKVLVYLLNPRDPAHTVPEIIKLLQQGDGNTHRSDLFAFYMTGIVFRDLAL